MEYTLRFSDSTTVKRYGCTRGHPHPTSTGAAECEAARLLGATDAELLALFNAEVAEYNA